MKGDPKNMDILRVIESRISSIDKENGGIKDRVVIKSLDALEKYYRALVQGKIEPEVDLIGIGNILYLSVIENLDKKRKLSVEEEQPKRRSFSRVLRKETDDEKFLAAIRKVKKSAEFWTMEAGERGYLTYISQFF